MEYFDPIKIQHSHRYLNIPYDVMSYFSLDGIFSIKILCQFRYKNDLINLKITSSVNDYLKLLTSHEYPEKNILFYVSFYFTYIMGNFQFDRYLR